MIHAHHPPVPLTFVDFHTHMCLFGHLRPIFVNPPDNHPATFPAPTALVPGGAMCTAGMAMLGFALQPTRLHAMHLLMRHFLMKIMLNPPEQASPICFSLPGPLQPIISSLC